MSDSSNKIKYKNIPYYTGAFFAAAGIVLLAYFYSGIFTDYSVLVNDLESQYIHFFSYYRNHIAENGVFYSFSKGLGGNFFGIFTYYLASGLNLILFLFPAEKIEFAVGFIMVLRFGLSSVSFCWFLNREFKNCNKIISGVFAVIYALSSFTVVLSYHLLWADAFFMLPVITAFALDIFRGKSIRNFVIAYSYMVISNYYMAYMIGIFCVLLYVRQAVLDFDLKTNIQNFKRIFTGAFLSVLITLFITLSSVFALLQGKYQGDEFLRENTGIRVFNIFALIPKLFTGAYDSVGNISAPFVYTAAFVGFLFIGIFFLKNLSLREKIADIIPIAFMAVSLIFTPFYMVWHMFSVPNGFPYRFTYIFAFFILWIGFKVFYNFKYINLKPYLTLVSCLIIILVIAGFVYPVNIRIRYILLTVIFIVTSLGVLCLYQLKNKKIFSALFGIFVLCEMCLNCCMLVNKNYTALGKTDINAYTAEYSTLTESLNTLPDGFYRINTGSFITNHSFSFGINSTTTPYTSLPETYADNIYQNIYKNSVLDIISSFVGAEYSIYDNIAYPNSFKVFPIMYTVDKGDFNYENGDYISSFIYECFGVNVRNEDGSINYENLNTAAQKAQNAKGEIIYQNKNKITVKTNSKTDCMLMTSLVYDESWNIYINGQKADKKAVMDSFLGVDLPKGECSVEFVYIPKGFILGFGVSVLTAVSLLIVWIIKKLKKTKEKQSVSAV